MSKIIEINNCFNCPHVLSHYGSPVFCCNHPDVPKVGKRANLNHIPSWCPLPDSAVKEVK